MLGNLNNCHEDSTYYLTVKLYEEYLYRSIVKLIWHRSVFQ